MHNFEKNLLRCAWSPDGSKVAAGSADKMVYIWQVLAPHAKPYAVHPKPQTPNLAPALLPGGSAHGPVYSSADGMSLLPPLSPPPLSLCSLPICRSPSRPRDEMAGKLDQRAQDGDTV